jgi:hypothetical protein
MKNFLLLFCVGLIFNNYIYAQPLKTDTLQYNGNIDRFINIVILGDGYTVSEQNKFVEDAKNMSDYIFTQSPWKEYRKYFNVFAIEVISEESGIKHPGTSNDGDCAGVPVSNPTTYFATTFDYGGIHRLSVPTNYTNISSTLSTHFPKYDQVIMLANSPYYGGSGGSEATSTTHSSSSEIVAHEIAHSFASLADEYYAGDQYNREKPNMTQETNPDKIKWKNWLGSNEVGIYPYGTSGLQSLWFRPHQNCKMNYLGKPYCSVCSQTIIEKIHKLTNPILSYNPIVKYIYMTAYNDFKLTLIKPIPNTLNIKWSLDSYPLDYNNMDSIRITSQQIGEDGMHVLTAIVEDTTELLRVDNHSEVHLNQISWTINKNVGITNSETNNITYSIFPNPTNDIINYSVVTKKSLPLSIKISNVDGVIIEQIENMIYEKFIGNYSMKSLPNGVYFITFINGKLAHSLKFIKE